MLKSMTAYGRAAISTELGRFSAEVQSVNRKHLEINIFLSKELQRFESEIRKVLASKIARGQVTFKLFVYFETASPVAVIPNIPLARQMKAAFEEIAKDLQLPNKVTLEMLAQNEDILSFSEEMPDEEAYRHAVVQVAASALEQFLKMREHEGKALQNDIAGRLKLIEKSLAQIAVHAPNASIRYRQKLVERLNEVLPGAVENEERILREVCLYAEKVDIAEEITRFQSHLAQGYKLLSSDQSVGKTFEFLLQELGREINTIGSKSSEMEISKLVIEIKSELERIREQIQNVE